MSTPMSVIQRTEQFDIQHGPGAVQVHGWLVYADGAMRQNIEGGELREPPEDPTELFPILAVYNEQKRKIGYQPPQQTYQPTPAERVREFHLRHEADAILINGWWYYGDGAQRDANILGPMIEPSPDPLERYKSQLIYREELLRRATADFNETKRQMVERAKFNLKESVAVPPPPCEIEQAQHHLKMLKARVSECQQAYDEARETLESVKPAWLREREAAAAANRERNEMFAAAVSGIQA